MKYLKIFLLSTILTSIIFAQNTKEQKIELKTQDDSISYSIGQNIGKNLKDADLNINFELLYQGMKDQVKGSSLLTDTDIQRVMIAFNQKLIAKRNAQLKAQKEKNKKEAEAFLEENKKKEGVVTLPSGLQYKKLVSGNGPSPKETSIVKVHYVGKLIDGREFDNSYKRGEPAEFPLNQVIKGWTEALQLMHVGDKWILYVPPELGYGENGAGNTIEPNSLLIFEVELLDILN
ncbi:FKBP-type peptidyl-prolyl cis-trans isomerase [Rosettibacter firmus]|uniref:FKBP-type peptidyl-prolyl cis-trans isomerase n=1 Tax=Rosettibacter firmus TaxID=3111522 RepID=UPI00336C0946